MNGEAVYGARPTPFGDELGEWSAQGREGRARPALFWPQTEWRVTTKPGKLYLTFFGEPRVAIHVAGDAEHDQARLPSWRTALRSRSKTGS